MYTIFFPAIYLNQKSIFYENILIQYIWIPKIFIFECNIKSFFSIFFYYFDKSRYQINKLKYNNKKWNENVKNETWLIIRY